MGARRSDDKRNDRSLRTVREEHQSVHEYVAGLVSAGVLGIAGINAFYNAPLFVKHWKAMWPSLRERIIKDNPWFIDAENKFYKYVGARYSFTQAAGTGKQPFVFSHNIKYADEYAEAINVVAARNKEIILDYIGQMNKHGYVADMYLSAIKHKINVPETVTADELADIAASDTTIFSKLRNELSKALGTIGSIESINTGDAEQTLMYRVSAHSRAAISIRESARTYDTTLIELPAANHPYTSIQRIERIEQPMQFFEGLRQHGSIRWTDTSVYDKLGYTGKVKFANISTELKNTYARISEALRNKLGPLNVSATITTDLISYGGAEHRGIRVTIVAEADNVILRGTDNKKLRVTKHIDIPLGNIDNEIHLGRVNYPYVGYLKRMGGLAYTPATEYMRVIADNADDLAVGIYDSLVGAGDRKFNMTLNKMYSGMAQRLEPAVGNRKWGLLSLFHDDINKFYPGVQPTADERNEINKRLREKVAVYKQSVYSTMSAEQVKALADEVTSLRYMVGASAGITDRLRRYITMLGGKVVDETSMARIYWEVPATHAGFYRYVSVFNDSPFKYIRNPQTQQYQYWNTYMLRDDIKNVFPVRWGDDAPVPERSFIKSRALYILNELYPFSDDEIFITKRFKHIVERSVDAAEPREIRIPRSGPGGPINIVNKDPQLRAIFDSLIAHSHNYSGSNLDAVARLREELLSKNIIIKANSVIAQLPNGDLVRNGKWDFAVENVVIDNEEVVLVGKSRMSNLRLRSSLLGKSTPKTVDSWSTIFGRDYSDMLKDVDMVAGGNVGRKITPHELKISVLMDAIDRHLAHIDNINLRLDNAAKHPERYSPGIVRNNLNRLNRIKERVRRAAAAVGATYDEAQNLVRFSPITNYSDLMTYLNNASSANIDKAMIELGEVYSKAEVAEFQRVLGYTRGSYGERFDVQGQVLDGLPDSVREWLNHNLPAEGGARYLRLLQIDGAHVLGVKALSGIAAMRQSSDDFYRVYRFTDKSRVGIPVKWYELSFLWDAYVDVPDTYRERIKEPFARFVEGIRQQMGGKKLAREYYKFIFPAKVAPEPGERVFDMSNPADAKMVTDLINRTDIGSQHVPMYISESSGVVTQQEAFRLRAVGEEVKEIPAYRVPRERLGIYDPTKGAMGAWIKLKNPVSLTLNGIEYKTSYIPVPNVMMMKHTMFRDTSSTGEFFIVPRTYGRAANMIKSIIHGRPAQDDYGRFARDIIEEFFFGKESALRTQVLTAHMPGLQGIVMSGEHIPLHRRRLVGGNASIGAGEITTVSGSLAPTDIAVSTKAFRDIEHDVRRVLREHYMKELSYSNPGISPLELDEHVNAKVADHIKDIKAGRRSVPVAVTRHPVTGPHARLFSRMFVLSELNKPEYARRIVVGELLQKVIWADFDFDLVQVMLATHAPGWSAMEELAEAQVIEGSDMFNFASQQAADMYKTDLRTAGGKVIKVPRYYKIKDGTVHVLDTVEEKGIRRVTSTLKPLLDEHGNPVRISATEIIEYLADCINSGQAPTETDIDLYQKIPDEIKRKADRNVLGAIDEYMTQRYAPMLAQKGIVGAATSEYVFAVNTIARNTLSQEARGHLSKALARMVQVVSLKAKTWRDVEAGLNKFSKFEAAYRNITSMNDTYANILRDDFGFTDTEIRSLLSIPLPLRRKNVYQAAGDIYYGLMYRTGPVKQSDFAPHIRPMAASMMGKSEAEIVNYLIGRDADVTDHMVAGDMIHKMTALELISAPTKGASDMVTELDISEYPRARMFNIKGKIDAINRSKQKIYEFKTVSTEVFNKLQNATKPLDEHLSQVNTYLAVVGPKHYTADIIYIERAESGAARRKIFRGIGYDEQRWISDLRKMSNARTTAESIISAHKSFEQRVIDAVHSGTPAMAELAEESGLAEIAGKGVIRTLASDDEYLYKHPEFNYFRKKRLVGPLVRNRLDDTVLSDIVGKEAASVARLGLFYGAVAASVLTLATFIKKDQFSGMGEIAGLGGEFWTPIKGSRADLPWGGYLFGYHVPFMGTPIDVRESQIYDRPKPARIELYDPVLQEKLARIPGRLLNTVSPRNDDRLTYISKPHVIIQ